MNLTLNPNLTPFRDKEGQYIEVLALLPNKVVFLYALEQTDNVDVLIHEYKVGDKLYFSEDGQLNRSVKLAVEQTSTTANKQSPSRQPIDHNARY